MIAWQESNIEWPKSLVQIAADSIRIGIIRRKLVLGQPLIESRLAKDLGISKTPIREGLSLALRRSGVRSTSSWISSLQHDPEGVDRFL